MKRSQALPQWVAFTLLAFGGAAIDLASKAAVFTWRGTPGLQPTYWLIENYVGIQTAVNEGALFGMGAGFGSVFALLSVLAGIGILVWLGWFGAIESWWLSIALGCVMAGIFGNLYDRLGLWWQSDYPAEWKSGVRDWILLCYRDYTWPNFNIADSLLVTGAIMLAIHSFKSPKTTEPKLETSNATQSPPAAGR